MNNDKFSIHPLVALFGIYVLSITINNVLRTINNISEQNAAIKVSKNLTTAFKNTKGDE
jgi:hypothetical protein